MERYNKIKDKYLESREKSIVRNYYSKESNKGKSYSANYIDSLLIVLLLFMLLALFLIIKANSIALPIYISLITIFFVSKAIKSLKEKKNNEKIMQVREDLKSKRITRELSQLNREEFIDYTKSILEKYYQSEFTYGEAGIDLTGSVRGKKYAVKCIKSTLEDRIIRKKVDDFKNYIKYLNYDEGIIITNSYFQDNIKENSSLILFDFMGIKEILKNIDEYPTDEEINSYIIYRFDERKKNIENQIKHITIKKIIKLYSIFIVFYVISYFVQYSYYYKVMAVISFVVATILGGYKITENIRVKGKFTLLK